MYTLGLALSLVHPGPFQLITVTLSILMTYYVDITTMVYMIDKTVYLNL